MRKERLSFNLRSFNDRVSKEELIYKIPEGKLSGLRLQLPADQDRRAARPHHPSLQPGELKTGDHPAAAARPTNLRGRRRQGL